MASRPTLLIDRLPEVATAASLLAIMEKLRRGPCSVKLEASRVTSLGASGVETLLVLTKTQRDRGDSLVLEAASEPFLASLAQFGVRPDELKSPATEATP
ncbi:MAG: STAS domain-containing protein [Pseudomonadota bacterium]